MYDLDIIGAEVCAILKQVPEIQYNKIPLKIRNTFEKYKEDSYTVQIDLDKKFEDQKISKEAKDIIFFISLNYWLIEEKKQKVLEKLKKNEEKLNEKYDVEKMFGNAENIEEYVNTNKIVKYERQKWYIKFWSRLRKIFKKEKGCI